MKTPWLVLVESNTSGTGRLFVREAHALGLRPILMATIPERYPYVAADGLDVISVDTNHPQEILSACIELTKSARIAGVFSSSEYYVGTAAEVAHSLGLPCADYLRVRDCRNKFLQRQALESGGIPIPHFASAVSPEEACSVAQGLGFPGVVKPVLGTGSIGVRRCATTAEVRAQARTLLRHTSNERGIPVPRMVLIEEVVDGAEYSVETIGRVIVGVTAKHLGPPPHFVEMGHDVPAPLTGDAADSIILTASRSLSALGLGWGPAHIEIRLSADGPRLIEVNPRLAGDYIPELYRYAFGIDLIADTLRVATGRAPELARRQSSGASVIRFLMPSRTGRVLFVEGIEAARAVQGVETVAITRRAGESVELRGDYRDRLGYVIASGQSVEAATDTANTASAFIKCHICED